jgi:segregation and condensation protein A
MTDGFQLSLPGFDGPIADLPSVVSARQLALDEIPLASIPSQFLASVRDGDVDLSAAGEVLAATARLMLMKSVQLLARPEETEEDAGELPSRERDQSISGPSVLLGERQGKAAYPSVGRPDSVPRNAGSRPISGLVDAWRAMLARDTEGRARATVPAFVRLEVAISRIISRLSGGARLSFRRLIHGSSREDAVMHFLATLELVRRGDVHVEQAELFGDIGVQWTSEGRERSDRAG